MAPSPSPTTVPANKISGNWRIDSLVSVFRDSLGRVTGSQLYPQQPGSVYYFQFNNNGTWVESANFSIPSPSELDAGNGTYVLQADTAFDLINVGNQASHCRITRLTDNSFVFTRTAPAVFNGTMPGTTERIFTLKR